MSKTNPNLDADQFRDHIGNVDDKTGKRKWIYPKLPSGKFYNYRSVFSYLLLAVLFAMPFIKIHGRPLMLFNLLERKFIIFGVAFWPQDFVLLGLAMLSFIVFIVLFTAVYGRLFCGWVCPQTIFLEMVFRRIENFIEGNAGQQQKLDAAPWTSEKILKKTAKHTIFFGISFLIANIFLAYIIGVDTLWTIMTDNPARHVVGLLAILAFTTVFYLVFAKMRELVCIWACPYGRLQGVLLDKDSIVVAYDFVRGEPRGKIRKGDTTPKGDCVDCGLCVDVCPTGIDIRNGTQLECVNCTACIDACDAVMKKIDKPKGLIRYASLEGIKSKRNFHFNTRMKAYTALLALLLGAFIFLLSTRDDVEATILRTPGTMYTETTDGQVANLYSLELVNKTFHDVPVQLQLEDIEGKIKYVGQDPASVKREEIFTGAFFIEVPKDKILKNNTKIHINILVNGKMIDKVKTSFLGPVE